MYGYSKLVEHILLSAAAEKQVRFSVIVAEVRPNCEGYELYSNLKEKIAVVKLIIDANIGNTCHLFDERLKLFILPKLQPMLWRRLILCWWELNPWLRMEESLIG